MVRGIFISYRRSTGSTMARMINDRLRFETKYAVYLDVDELHAGNFHEAIRNKIRSSSHFVLILSKNALDRCIDPDDLVRAEISMAMEYGLSIIPVTEEGFTWPENLPTELAPLKKLNAIPYIQVYSQAFFKRLYTFLEPEKTSGYGYKTDSYRGTNSKTSNTERTESKLYHSLDIYDLIEKAIPNIKKLLYWDTDIKKKLFIGAVIICVLQAISGLSSSSRQANRAKANSTKPTQEVSLKSENTNSSIGEAFSHDNTISLISRDSENSNRASILNDSYVEDGKDWKNSLLLSPCSNSLILGGVGELAYNDFDLNNEFDSMSVDYVPYRDKYGESSVLSLYVINMDNGEVLWGKEKIRGDTNAGTIEVSTAGINTLRLLAVYENGKDYGQQILLGNGKLFASKTRDENVVHEKTKVKLSSRETGNSHNIDFKTQSYISGGVDWAQSTIFVTRTERDTLYYGTPPTDAYMIYDLDSEFAELSFDYTSSAFTDSSVCSMVITNDETGEILYSVEKIRQDNSKKTVSIDVTGVKQLKIAVYYLDGPDTKDQWLFIKNASLTKDSTS